MLKQRWKKGYRWGLGILAILLCGCSAQEGPELPQPSIVPTSTPSPETNEKEDSSKPRWLRDMDTALYEFSHDYQLEMTDSAWVFTDDLKHGDIVVNLINEEITFDFPDVTIEYKKKDRVMKTAVFSAQLNMRLDGSDFSWQSAVDTEDRQHYPIQFDPKKIEIQDGESGSSTKGQKMNFSPSLYGQCLSYMKRYWNQSVVQQALIEQAVKASQSHTNSNAGTVNVERPLDKMVNILEPGSITPDITLEVEMNFNEITDISLSEANKLQRTLYLFTVMKRGFDDPSKIDWEALAPSLMSMIPNYGCDGKYCKDREGQVRFADFAIPEGYGALATQPEMNRAAKVLTGQDFVYDDYENRKLSSGAVYSQSANSYITYSREGDWMPASPGIMILDQTKKDNRITVDFVAYRVEWKDNELFVEGVKVAEVKGNNANPQIVQTVKENLDRLPHWTAELEDTGDEHFYRLIRASRK